MVGVLQTMIGIDWYQNILDFDHIGKILDLFRGGKFLCFEHCRCGQVQRLYGLSSRMKANSAKLTVRI